MESREQFIPDKRLKELQASVRPFGYTAQCPNCGAENSFYSCLDAGWVCLDCGLLFHPVYVLDIIDRPIQSRHGISRVKKGKVEIEESEVLPEGATILTAEWLQSIVKES